MIHATATKLLKREKLPSFDPEIFSNALATVFRKRAVIYHGLLFERANGQNKISGRRHCFGLDSELETACDRLIETNKHPGLDIGKGRHTPFEFAEDVERLSRDPDIAAFLDAIDKSDYRSVYCLPFRDLTGAVYVSTVASRDRLLCGLEMRLTYSYCLDAFEKLQIATPANGGVALLTSRERECLIAAARGLTEKQSGRLLSISPHTVRSHLDKCRSKLRAHNKLNAIIKGFQTGEIKQTDIEK